MNCRDVREIADSFLCEQLLTETNHEENQSSHLTLYDDNVPEAVILKAYDGPEQRYCPVTVYFKEIRVI